MRAIVAGDHPFTKKVVSRADATEALQRPALQAGAHRGAPRGRGDLHLHAGHFHRPLPRSARGQHEAAPAGRFQAHLDCRRLLARGREEQDAAAHLRHRVGVEGGAGGAPQEARGDREARPPPAGHGAGPVLHPRGGGSRPHLLASQGRARPPRHRGLLAPGAPQERLRASSTRRTSASPGSGRPRGTSGSTSRTCTRRCRSTTWTTTSSR